MSTPPKRLIHPILVRIFAVIGVIATLLILTIMLVALHAQMTTPSEPETVILSLNLDVPIVEQNDASPVDLALHEQSTQLLDILHAIDKARADPHVKGLVAHFGGTQPSLAQAQEIRAAVARFRASGKMAYAFGSTYGDFGNGSRAYYLASGFDEIWLQPVGAVSLTGIAIQAPFGKNAFDKLGVAGDFMQREEYKSVMETFTRDSFSPPVRANMQSMIDSLADQIATGIAEGRKWDIERVKRLVLRGPYTATEALKAGLVTRVGYADELDEELKKKIDKDVEDVELDDYLAFSSDGSKAKTKARIALIYGVGLITDHAGGAADVTGETIMGADTIAGAFNDAADDKKIKAILFRIDSPGGSPAASETIRRAMVHAQKAGKPVFVSMGNVAASGGYWVAMNADGIMAEPGTITGSIGVVAGKFTAGGLMQKIGVTWDTLTTGGNGDMWSVAKGFSPEQRERVNALLDETYRSFVENVSAARKIPIAKMPDIAKGRVFTGAQAMKLGLVDALGGYDIAFGAIRKKLGLSPDDMISIELFPAPLSPAEKVFKILKGIGIEGAFIRTAMMQWHSLQVLLGPVWDGMGGVGRVAARVPMLPTVR